MPLVNLKCISIAFTLVLTVVATVAYAQQQASCEQNRLQCQKDWAQTNSFGVPVTPPDKTKLCWDGYNACVAAGNAKPDAARTMASLPPMKRFELRKSGEISTFSECHIDGTEVRCKGGQTPRPGLHSYESIVTGRISGSVITGDFLVRIVSGDQDCITHTEISGPLTVTLRPNGEAAVQHASLQMRQPKNSGARCSPLRTEMIPASQETQSWRVLE